MLVPVILCGGSGTRLWPLSRKLYPKQLLPLTGPLSPLQETVRRLEGLETIVDGFVAMCNEHHRFMVAEQLRQVDAAPRAIILEPVGRNTAPAVTVAAIMLAETLEYDPVLLMLPADHVITSRDRFHESVKRGISFAEDGRIVMFGVDPGGPETGYGYIRRGTSIEAKAPQAFEVSGFIEKPGLEDAETLLQSGSYFWNSGIFMFQASVWLAAMGRHAPAILEPCKVAVANRTYDLDFERLHAEAFARSPSDSVDYAVMEKVDGAIVVRLDAGWSDLSSFEALRAVGQQDPAFNTTRGDVLLRDVSGSYFHSEGRLLTGVGVKDLIVVETKDAVLVSTRDRVHDVTEIVSRLREAGRNEAESHARVYRPWGSYETVDAGDRFHVKRIIVKPGAKLSLQKHFHRSEHWVVVRGTALVTRGDDHLTLTEDKSVYIPVGTHHRLENPGRIPLELIEVQTGTYLGEDDIMRFDDIYGRSRE